MYVTFVYIFYSDSNLNNYFLLFTMNLKFYNIINPITTTPTTTTTTLTTTPTTTTIPFLQST